MYKADTLEIARLDQEKAWVWVRSVQPYRGNACPPGILLAIEIDRLER